MPNLYDQIASKVRESGAETLTVDLFDTILLRKTWPVQLQDLQTAAAWKTNLPDLFGTCSPSAILTWRQHAYNELKSLHSTDLLTEFQPNLEAWFTCLVDLVTNFYQLTFSDEKRSEFVATMIQCELDATISQLTPNRPFLDALASLKQALPELKIYFLEDSSYRTTELQKLLDHFEITVFDGGLSSADAAVTKQSGRLYQYIQDTDSLSNDFNLKKNLNLGDSHSADYSQALRSGSHAMHYRPIRCRGLRTLVGYFQSLYLTRRENNFPDKTALAPLHFCLYGTRHPETKALIPGELSDKFKNLILPTNLQLTDKLSYLSICQATVWLLANRHDQTWNTRAIIHIITTYLDDNTRSSIYDFCFQNNFPRSDYLLNCRSDEEFCSALLYDLTTADTEFTAHLRQAYVDLAELLPLAQEGITIIETDKRQPIARLFREFAKLHSVNTPIQAQNL